jgi:hypothetical protein
MANGWIEVDKKAQNGPKVMKKVRDGKSLFFLV